MMGRCTSVTEREVCNRGGSSVGSDLLFTVAGDVRLPELCIYSCFHQSECGEGALCRIAVVFHPPLRTVMAACDVARVLGSTAFGEPCVRDGDCQSQTCVGGRCTVVCRDEADCGGVLPACLAVDLSAERFVTARPDDWPTPWPLLCAPAP
jgi:hypothetical protein